MSITRTNAKKFIAKAIGGLNDSKILDMAEEALQRTFEDWQAAKNWYFMLKDTTLGFTVASCVLNGTNGVVSAPSSGAFDGVNTTVGVTGTGVAANTTVLSYTRASDGTIASITLSSTPSAGTVTLTFAGDIPVLVGTQDYNLPTDFLAPYHLRMTEKRLPLDYIQYRYWNMKIIDHTIQGLPVAYTVYNAVSAETQNFGTYRLRVFRIPQGDVLGTHYDTFTQQYYRKFNHDSDPLDIPDRYLYKFLDYAQWKLLEKKDATSDRLPSMQSSALSALQSAMTDDEEVCEEEEQTRLVSQMESGLVPRPLWSNSQFSIYYGEL